MCLPAGAGDPSWAGKGRELPLSKQGWGWLRDPRGMKLWSSHPHHELLGFSNPPCSISLPSLLTVAFFPPCSICSFLYSVISSARSATLPLYFLPFPGLMQTPHSSLPFPSESSIPFSLSLLWSPMSSVISSTRKCEGEDQPERCQLFAQGGVGGSLGPWAGLGYSVGLGAWVFCGLSFPQLLPSCLLLFPTLVPNRGKKATDILNTYLFI